MYYLGAGSGKDYNTAKWLTSEGKTAFSFLETRQKEVGNDADSNYLSSPLNTEIPQAHPALKESKYLVSPMFNYQHATNDIHEY